jgi:rubrerythrin
MMETKSSHSRQWKIGRFLLTLTVILLAMAGKLLTSNQAAKKPQVVMGRLVCLDSDAVEAPCAGAMGPWALKTREQKVYRLQAGKVLHTLNREERLRTREFRVTLFEIPGSGEFEITNALLVRGGKIFSFSYFCPVCHITTYTLGPCPCCQDAMEYREKEVGPAE